MNLAFETDPPPAAVPSPSSLGEGAHFRRRLAARLAAYQAGLLAGFRDEPARFVHFAQLALKEAESLGWATQYAHLFLPVLAEEKIESVRRWTGWQFRIGSGLAGGDYAAGHDEIRWHELAGMQPPDFLATGRASRSSEVTSRAFEIARSEARP